MSHKVTKSHPGTLFTGKISMTISEFDRLGQEVKRKNWQSIGFNINAPNIQNYILFQFSSNCKMDFLQQAYR